MRPSVDLPTLPDHVRGHLSRPQADVAAALVLPITMEQAMGLLGYRHRSSIERYWQGVRDRLSLYTLLPEDDASPGTTALMRVALTRIVFGVDPCPCGRGEP